MFATSFKICVAGFCVCINKYNFKKTSSAIGFVCEETLIIGLLKKSFQIKYFESLIFFLEIIWKLLENYLLLIIVVFVMVVMVFVVI
jgi:hypothetical protein